MSKCEKKDSKFLNVALYVKGLIKSWFKTLQSKEEFEVSFDELDRYMNYSIIVGGNNLITTIIRKLIQVQWIQMLI